MSQDIVSDRTRELLVAMRNLQREFDRVHGVVAQGGYMSNREGYKNLICEMQDKVLNLVTEILTTNIRDNLTMDEKQL